MILVWSCSCLCPIHWSQVLIREWRCSWSSTDRRCSNYIWVIHNIISCYGATYIRGLTVYGSCGPMKKLLNVINLACRTNDNFQWLVKQNFLGPYGQWTLTLNMRGTKLSRFNWVNIMDADALAPYVARTSAAMILTMQDLVLPEEAF